MISLGTSAFLFGCIGLSVPALLEERNKYFTSKEGYLGYADHQMTTDQTTLVTHLFYHQDINHFVSNWSSIFYSALNLDLGFFRSSVLFLASGIGGALVQVVSDDLPNAHLHLIKFFKSIWNRQPVLSLKRYYLCGSSAATFGFMGAEVGYYIKHISRLYTNKQYRKRFNAEQEVAQSLVMLLTRVGSLCLQCYWIYYPPTDDSLVFLALPKVGFHSHVGGFAIGLALSFLGIA
ncbi:hypothetical protein EDD86DRAFT_243699 [Gorgonomyces haynaldii]|nr:hypothetical protein EDD86DRAFT_243699 [Gorgonomyces haynaldii]